MVHHSPSYSITMRLRYADKPGQLGRITSAIGEADGLIGAVDIVNVLQEKIVRDIGVNAKDLGHADRIVEAVKAISDVEVVSVSDRTFLLHLGGKIEVQSKTSIKTSTASFSSLAGALRLQDLHLSDSHARCEKRLPYRAYLDGYGI